MRRANIASAAAAVALLSSTAPPADALEFAESMSTAVLNGGLIQEAAYVHHGPQRTTVHHAPRGTAVHHGPQATAVHHAPQRTAVHHAPQGTPVHGRPGYHPPYRAYHPAHPYRPAYHPPAYHPAYRPAYHPAYRPAYQPVVRPPAPANPPAPAARAVWSRPTWYHWAPGGAVAAGVALGFLGAAAVTSWAPTPPQPGLCWYYTDPSQRDGFWDVCP